nr:antitoxin Xre-like helix-turn-helix domain-containing protein [Halomonas pellis]
MRAYPNIANDWGLKEQEAALLLGVPESTYRRWRKHEVTPSRAAQAIVQRSGG